MIAHKLAGRRRAARRDLAHPRAHRPRARRSRGSRPTRGPDLPASGGPPAVRPRAGPGDGLRYARRAAAPAGPRARPRRRAAASADSPSASVTRRAIHPAASCSRPGGWRFGGDVLFQGSIGRTDLPGGDFDTLVKSIERELLTLPDSTIVYSGHGPETTVRTRAPRQSLPHRRLTASARPRPTCLRCGAEVRPKPWGCKSPCPNCGFIYPLGDCSD